MIKRSIATGAVCLAFFGVVLFSTGAMARPPLFTIDPIDDQTFRANAIFRYQATYTVEDPVCWEGRPAFDLRDAPSGMTITRNGKIEWRRIRHDQIGRTFQVQVHATASTPPGVPCFGNRGQDFASFMVTVGQGRPIVCGDGRCQFDEQYGACPADCGSGTTSFENSTIPNFLERWDAIIGKRVYSSMWECGGSGPQCLPSGAAWVSMQELSRCHAQGFARLNQPGYLAFVSTTMAGNETPLTSGFCAEPTEQALNAGDGAWLYIVNLASKEIHGPNQWGSNRRNSSAKSAPRTDRVSVAVKLNAGPQTGIVPESRPMFHPGGIQVIGDYVLVGIDDRGRFGGSRDSVVFLFNVNDPENQQPTLVPGATLIDPDDGAETVGIVRLENGHYLMVKGSNGTSLLKYYMSATADIKDPRWALFYIWKRPIGCRSARHGRRICNPTDHRDLTHMKWENYQSINLFREEGTNDLYLVGTHNTGSLGGEIFGTNIADVWRLHMGEVPRPSEQCGRRVTECKDPWGVWPMDDSLGLHDRDFQDGDDAYNFAAAASVYVHPGKGTPHVYAIEKTPERDGLDRYFRFGELW